MPLLRAHDDADAPIALHIAGVPGALRSLLPGRPRDGRDTLGTWLGRLTLGLLRGETLMAGGTLLLLAVVVTLAIKEPSTGMYLLLLSPIASSLVVALAGGLVLLGITHRGLKRRIVRVSLAGRRCPCCRYALSGLAAPAGSAHATLLACPECGSRWDARRLGAHYREQPRVVVIRQEPAPTMNDPAAPSAPDARPKPTEPA